MDGNVLPCVWWRSGSAADYDNAEMLRIQARYPAGHLPQEAVKCGCCCDAHNAFVIALQVLRHREVVCSKGV